MLGSTNILGPKDGKPIVTPSQDIVLGNYYLTLEDVGAIGEGTVFADRNEVDHAYFAKTVNLHTRVAIKASALHNATFTEAQNNSSLMISLMDNSHLSMNQVKKTYLEHLIDTLFQWELILKHILLLNNQLNH